MKLPQISIIIPVLNEESIVKVQLQRILDRISYLSIVSEIIVVDGGSEDGTQSILTSFPQLTILNSERGRAKQMNVGARAASSKILYFLHIDAIPPKYFDVHIATKYQTNHKAGCFQMNFRSKHPWLRLMGWFTRFNHPWCRGGDQSLFIDRDLFWELGGYDEDFIIYEDNMLIGKLYEYGEFCVIDETLTTSARMYEQYGVGRIQWLYLLIYFKKWKGASPSELYDFFVFSIKKS